MPPPSLREAVDGCDIFTFCQQLRAASALSDSFALDVSFVRICRDFLLFFPPHTPPPLVHSNSLLDKQMYYRGSFPTRTERSPYQTLSRWTSHWPHKLYTSSMKGFPVYAPVPPHPSEITAPPCHQHGCPPHRHDNTSTATPYPLRVDA
ncbi:unnamed protein product [Prunus armeniaca]|uniref:Uncharacterized protein n=1 Tax=Prunus armeniaca TaxID=36596 RepID=A0A6J5U2I6_PRUAR|nr:unnamed protein product [Prunus armeniaca]